MLGACAEQKVPWDQHKGAEAVTPAVPHKAILPQDGSFTGWSEEAQQKCRVAHTFTTVRWSPQEGSQHRTYIGERVSNSSSELAEKEMISAVFGKLCCHGINKLSHQSRLYKGSVWNAPGARTGQLLSKVQRPHMISLESSLVLLLATNKKYSIHFVIAHYDIKSN